MSAVDVLDQPMTGWVHRIRLQRLERHGLDQLHHILSGESRSTRVKKGAKGKGGQGDTLHYVDML